VLERAKGQVVTGVVGGEGISWSVGQKRGLGLEVQFGTGFPHKILIYM
jgi:hypothetical protein